MRRNLAVALLAALPLTGCAAGNADTAADRAVEPPPAGIAVSYLAREIVSASGEVGLSAGCVEAQLSRLSAVDVMALSLGSPLASSEAKSIASSAPVTCAP